MTSDLLDGAHEDVRDDGNAEETPEHRDEVENRADTVRPGVLADQRQKKSLVRTRVVVEVGKWTAGRQVEEWRKRISFVIRHLDDVIETSANQHEGTVTGALG